jgi:hypothetical protein
MIEEILHSGRAIMKRKILVRILLTVFILLFLTFLFNIYNSLFGNPISAAIAASKIHDYVNQTYSDMDIEVSEASFNFKFDEYYSRVKSKTSMDTCFTVSWSNGKIYDSYESDVTNRYMTYQRLSLEFTNEVEKIISEEFPYECSILFADFGKSDTELKSLTLDMPLNLENPPLPSTLTAYVLSKNVSYEFLRDRLLELANIMEKHDIKMDFYSVVIEEPLPEGEKAAPGGKSLYLYDFPAEKLTESDLMEAIRQHQKLYEDQTKK